MSFQRKLGKQLRASGFHAEYDPETNEPLSRGTRNPQGVKVATHRDPGDSRVGIVKAGSDTSPAVQFLRELGCEVEEHLDGFVVVSPPPGVDGNGAPALDGTMRVASPAGPKEITPREFRNDSGKVMRELGKGQMFLVTRNGVPVGELVPLRHQFVAAETAVRLFQSAPSMDYHDFRADLEAVADQDPTPRG